jgi:copper chaperone NosL
MKKYYYFLGILLLSLTACSVKPDPINYGTDGCSYCSMTIVDRQHAAEIVTSKGKAFKFDATECMMNHLKGEVNTEIALFLVNDYATPGELVNAVEATYLISENIPSPMGAYLSAFKSRETAESVRLDNGGTLLTWNELLDKFER